MTERGERDGVARRPELWLIDGFNVLHAGLPGGSPRERWWRDASRRRLLETVSGFDDPNAEIWVVFDGPGDSGEPGEGRIRVRFHASADDWLLARLRDESDVERVRVVTGDRRLAARLRQRGATVVKPRAFLARCDR